MPSSADLGPLDPRLEGVYRRGYRIRRARRTARIGMAAAMLQLVVALPLLAFRSDGSDELRLHVASPRTTVAETTTTLDPVVAVEEPTTTVAPPPPPTTTPPSTTAPPVCRNSHDSRCGPFRWDPDPGPNAPLTISITFEPAHPKAGEEVTFHVVATDSDASYFWGVCSRFGDETITGPDGWGTCIDGVTLVGDDPMAAYCDDAPKHGPWTPPPRQGKTDAFGDPHRPGVVHTYAEPGTYTFGYRVRSDTLLCGLHEPYGSIGETTVQVVVDPAEPAEAPPQ